MIIGCSINLSKIDKSKIVEGKEGKYYNFDVIVNDKPDNYGNNVAITDKQTKEERTAKAKKVYLGNGKVVWQKTAEKAVEEKPFNGNTGADDDLPF